MPDPTGKALKVRRPQSLTLNETMTLADVLAKSGYFSDAREMAQAVTKVLAGRELGFGPIASMTGVYIVKNKVTIGASLIAAAIKRHPVYDYKVTEHTDEACTVEIYERGQKTGTSRFTLVDARRAGLAGGTNWRAHPKNMLFARAISNAAKFYCPDVLGGPAPYTLEELEDIDGDTLTVTDKRGLDGKNPLVGVPAEEGNRPLTSEEADRLLAEIREGFAPTLDDMLVALSAIGVADARDPQTVVRSLTGDQALALLEELNTAKNKAAENGATDLPWVEEYVAGDRSA